MARSWELSCRVSSCHTEIQSVMNPTFYVYPDIFQFSTKLLQNQYVRFLNVKDTLLIGSIHFLNIQQCENFMLWCTYGKNKVPPRV